MSLYAPAIGLTDGAEYHNLFLLRFDQDGRVREYREWYMRRPPGE